MSKTHCKQFEFENIKPVQDFREKMMLTGICSQFPETQYFQATRCHTNKPN